MSYIFNRAYPTTRLRRLRYNDNIRAMVREVELSPKHLIAPVFVIEGKNQRVPINSMPNVERMSVDVLVNYAKELNRYYEVKVYSPEPRHFAVMFTDVTQRMETEKALKDSEAHHRFLTDNIMDVIWVYDIETGSVEALGADNRSFRSLAEYPSTCAIQARSAVAA